MCSSVLLKPVLVIVFVCVIYWTMLAIAALDELTFAMNHLAEAFIVKKLVFAVHNAILF